MTDLKEKEKVTAIVTIHFHPEPSQSHSPSANDLTPKKEGEDLFCWLLSVF